MGQRGEVLLLFFYPFFIRRYYMDKYNLAGEVLPHTAIIDPRTGTQLLKVVGYVEPEDLSMALVEFLESNSLDQVRLIETRPYFSVLSSSTFCGEVVIEDGVPQSSLAHSVLLTIINIYIYILSVFFVRYHRQPLVHRETCQPGRVLGHSSDLQAGKRTPVLNGPFCLLPKDCSILVAPGVWFESDTRKARRLFIKESERT